MAIEFDLSERVEEAAAPYRLATSYTPAAVKAAFHKWISDGRSKQRDPDRIITSWDQVSEQLLRRKLSSVPLWEITNQGLFAALYKKVMNDKLFRVTDRKTHSAFVQIGQLYLKFLKSKPVLLSVARIEAEAAIELSNRRKANIITVLEKHFPNGIRPNSIIDINKLKNYYYEITGERIVSTDIPTLLNTIGIRCGEKIFFVPLSGQKGLAELLDRLIYEDNRLFYYEEFYDVHADFLQSMNIFSFDLLKTVMFAIRPSLFYASNYCGVNINVTVPSEVLRCYATAACLSYGQLKAQLPYVPLDKIQQALMQSRDFIWVSTGVYTHISKVEIDGSERDAAEDKVKAEIAELGYTSLASLDISISLEQNPDLSEVAVKSSLFQLCLADRYEKRGNIITPKGTALNSVAIFKGYCLTHNRLTLEELLDFEKEINGKTHSQSLFVAYDTMIRVDKNTFIRDGDIDFDIEAIDKALALFVSTDVIPLRAVTSFTSFPYLEGYSWNLFLLESYCRRYSELFKYQCLSVNSKNVGAIFRKSAGFADYIAVLVTAVVNADVKLEEKEVGDFLFNSGYIAQRTSAIAKIVEKARVLRERSV